MRLYQIQKKKKKKEKLLSCITFGSVLDKTFYTSWYFYLAFIMHISSWWDILMLFLSMEQDFIYLFIYFEKKRTVSSDPLA